MPFNIAQILPVWTNIVVTKDRNNYYLISKVEKKEKKRRNCTPEEYIYPGQLDEAEATSAFTVS